MAIVSENGKYLTLENVRAYYDRINDKIVLTSTDPDIPKDSRGFKITVNSTSETGSTLRQMLGSTDVIPEYVEDLSPDVVTPDDIPGEFPWHTIPLGKSSPDEVVAWDVRNNPNLFLFGHAGSGKTNIAYQIVNHCLEFPETWEVEVYEAKHRWDYSTLIDYMEELRRRESNPNYDYKKKMLIIDDLSVLTTPDITKRQSSLEEQISSMLLELVDRGPYVGIYLVATAQHLYSSSFFTMQNFLQYFSMKVICGNVNMVGYMIFTNDEKPYHVKPRSGRACWIDGDQQRPFQPIKGK